MNIGVIGGTGPAGQALAVQYAAVGVEVLVGSRSQERCEGIVGEMTAKWPSRSLPLVPVENAVAAGADVVVLATPWEGLLATIGELTAGLEGKVVISMANALTRWGRGIVPLLPPSGSVTTAVALALPRSRVVGAFHHMPAGPWGDLEHPIEADVLVTSDDRAAAREVVALVDRLPGLRGVDAGGLGSALAIEAMTATLVEINRRYKAHAAIKLTGIEPHE
ncbi:MAG: NADPH-dependent F420 reductase [Acidimicrobiaceae bacterium]|nr:NADPH-dependent F420 reductase [Acidimicrobiaceae bacterium]MBO0748475.1 NADPH-dependent F420 reductase [Acidimicrobiaceae bacterium]